MRDQFLVDLNFFHVSAQYVGETCLVTRGDEILAVFFAARGELQRLAYAPHARHDVAGVIDPLGSRLESFLRVVALPNASRRDNLQDLIEKLRIAGLPAQRVDDLHGLRHLYNRSKHKPTEPLPLAEAMHVVREALAALTEIVASGTGAVAAPLERELNYHLWVGFWDHYTGGTTEIAIMLPSNHWTHVGTVDTLHMDIRTWDTLKPVLQTHSRFRLGQEHFDSEVWKSFCAEGDFLNAGVWDGEYGELVRLLAPTEDRSISERLFPWLRREANSTSVGTALIMAAVDIARAAPVPVAKEQLAADIMQRADSEYAIPSQGREVNDAAMQVAELIGTVPFTSWQHLAGPVLTLRRGGEVASAVPGPLHLELDGNALVLGFTDAISVTAYRFNADDE